MSYDYCYHLLPPLLKDSENLFFLKGQEWVVAGGSRPVFGGAPRTSGMSE